MNSTELFRAGMITEAIQAITEEVRNDPTDGRKRTFLFELLCFAGDYDRAEKQLNALSQGGQNAELGTLLYRAALHAERERNHFFETKAYLQTGSVRGTTAGMFNGRAFKEIADADPRIGARFEVFLSGQYMWVPFEHITAIRMEQPKRLRDLIWAPVLITVGPGFKYQELGEVLAPVLSPGTSTYYDDAVRLGRETVWEQVDGAEVPFGQKMLLIDGEEVPLLELRHLELAAVQAESAAV